MKKHVIALVAIFAFTTSWSQSKVTNASGTWTNPAIWTPTGVPTGTNDVTIANGHNVTINADASCNNLIVGQGGTASFLSFTGATARTLTVGGDITINSTGTFSVANNTATHSLVISGNLVNNGSFSLFRDNNSKADIVFLRNGNQTISGSGSLTRFNFITLNMGTSAANILEVSCPSFSATVNFLKLTNGTFKFSAPGRTVVPFNAATTVQATSGIWMNAATSLMSFSASIGLNGLLKLSNGTINVGNANNEDITAGTGTLSIDSGTLNISGKYNGSTSATTFSMTGGQMNISNNASTNTSIAPFHLSTTGTVFDMTGGTIVLRREGGSGAQDLGFVNTGSTGGSVTGGTLQLGNSTTPANQTISINSTHPIPNLVLASASVTAKILTNSVTVVNGITIVSGTLRANNLNMALGGNWTNTGTFVPGTGTVVFNGASAQSIFKSGGEAFNHLTFSGSGLKTFSAAVTASGNITISSGATVDVSSANQALGIRGNFVNNGSFIARAGLVTFSGTTSQSIGGTSTTNFYNLTLNNTSGASLSHAENLEGTLSLNNGTLNTNSQVFTLISNATGSGRIGQITGTGDISGNVTVERFVPGGTTGWTFLGAPISSALTLNDWDDDLYIACATCPDGSAGSFVSVYTYDETQTGAHDAANSYSAISTINDAIQPNKGYMVYLGNGQFTTTDITVDVTGSVRKNNQTINLNYTNTGATADDGWNLIQNPYPSAVSWAGLKGATANIDNAIYIYNPDLNSGAGGYASYVNGVSSPAVGAGGVDDNIAMCQGFFVHSTGATALNATESNKVSSNPTFLKSSAGPSALFRVNLYALNSTDETVVYFEPTATTNFEADFDSYKIPPGDPNVPQIATTSNGLDFQINGVQPLVGSFSIPLKTTSGAAGNFTIAIPDLNDMPQGVCINLWDKWNSVSTDLTNSTYAFYLPDTTLSPRFELHITLNGLSINSQLNQPSCAAPLSGSIVAKGLSQGPWNYTWKNNGHVLKTSPNKNSADTLDAISGGNIELQISTTGFCDNNTSYFTIVSQTPVTASFWSTDTLNLLQSTAVHFINTSQNSASSLWNSGAGNSSNQFSPVFNYSQPGIYFPSLIATSGTGCTDSVQKKLVVVEGPLYLKQLEKNVGLIVKTLGNNIYRVENTSGPANMEWWLTNAAGQQIQKARNKLNSALEINLSDYPTGIYCLTVLCNNQKSVVKLVAE